MPGDSIKKIVNDAPSMLWMANKEKQFVFFNKAWLDFRGQSMEAEIKGNWEESVFKEDLDKLHNQFEKSFQARKAYKVEYRLLRYDGTYRWIIENGTPHYDDKQHFLGFIGSCMDIHNLKELERRKDEFITAASHELKTPLTSLNVYLHLIEQYFKSEKLEKFSAYSDGAILQLNKITSLIDKLLDLNKIQAGSLTYSPGKFSFCDLATNIIEKVRLLYPERNIIFIKNCSAFICGDIDRLSQAIENMINNAIKFSKNKTEIKVEISEDHSFVYMDITDYGIGIEKPYQEKIFDRFFRIPGQQEQTYPGLGMGLYLTRKIIEKHNGSISVESKKNEFTKFSIKLPLLKDNK